MGGRRARRASKSEQKNNMEKKKGVESRKTRGTTFMGRSPGTEKHK